ncbi:MAG: acetyl-CoA carboxylase carboxyltransferase subunit beta [Planctomycetes bacterium]|nr:acetyl-CoA carboxylase carboxyltransferase subunit beta [Planctomycetota bacterium]
MPWSDFKKFVFRKKKEMPNGLWQRCDECNNLIYRKVVDERMKTCPECNYHFTLSAQERVDLLLDKGSFEEFWTNVAPADPLEFTALQSYKTKIDEAQKETGMKDAVVTGKGAINGKQIVVAVIDQRFMMGSMGSVMGEKITRAVEKAHELKLPLVIFSASGGARMQEGSLSLMQMAKTSTAIARFREDGGLYVSVLTNPTFAGVMASFASLGDIMLAEPRALIGFTGPRVIRETIKQELPEGFQMSEFMLEHGFIDRIVPRQKLREELFKIITYYRP